MFELFSILYPSQRSNMSEMSTSECKEFLFENFPLKEKGWKRVKKFKDDAGNTVREFSHTNISETVILIEDNGELRLSHDASPHNCMAFKKRMATLCTFTVIDDPDDDPEVGKHTLKMETIDADGESTDEYMPLLYYIFPSGWKATSPMEDEWEVRNALSEEDTIIALHDWGFQSNQEFDQRHSYGNPRSAWNCPALVKRVLEKNVDSSSAPASTLSKI